ncbi:sorbitol dehydrogenase [Onthophagus taurus]|uniref:sorbitol dehydrogenase n=1 Tax=Onthophagus taurus TaxID=166361 RepID=UPI000C20EA0F|nr:sorbitol dehydrogenase [Onthophagus taurus]
MAPIKEDNLTAVLYGINDIRLEQRPIPVPGDNDVLLRMESVGICGSDVHYLTRGEIGPFVVKQPMIIGHEASGTVAKIGKNVKHLKPGDRVAIEPGVPCRICSFCKEGRYNLCPDVIFCATPPVHGNLGRYYVHAADFCFKLPDNVSLDEGALLEPLSVGVHGCKRAGITVGSIVLVLGAGPIGLVTMMCAKAFGASKVLITDVFDHRLKLAKELGADYTLQINVDASTDDLAKKVIETLGSEPNVSMDCCGAQQMVQLAMKATKSGGVAVLIGMGQNEVTLPLTSALIREVDIKGIFRYANDYQTALDLVASGKVNVKPLVTHHFKIEETVDAFETAVKSLGNPVKIMIHANPEWKD